MLRKNRPSLNLLLDKKNLIGAEIGVHEGANAIWILKNLDIEKLYLIDPYGIYPSNNPNQTPTGPSPEAKETAGKQFKPYKDKIERIYKYSWDAIDDILDKSLDFVYIDGDHRGKAVYKDMQYYKKLRSGGLLCGHDWRFSSVKTTVDKFIGDMIITFTCCDSRQNIRAINRSASDCDWWIWMPEKNQIFRQKCNKCQRITSIVPEKINWQKK